jgi:hypothetical protein
MIPAHKHLNRFIVRCDFVRKSSGEERWHGKRRPTAQHTERVHSRLRASACDKAAFGEKSMQDKGPLRRAFVSAPPALPKRGPVVPRCGAFLCQRSETWTRLPSHIVGFMRRKRDKQDEEDGGEKPSQFWFSLTRFRKKLFLACGAPCQRASKSLCFSVRRDLRKKVRKNSLGNSARRKLAKG